ncbi:dual 3 -5 -cyclic-AMP and -GMP phosphodiesterase 11A [Brachionus plicatilis]|uniref:Dual 3-5-cyclic-AMP and-GMP phosphodiesterase 11A n=1 Tax=Brachionus plicatilis TaxID=10195 RepID=A0A3M7RWT3_BRAPC|nr:dual 3 -5 -cyclic-AMP and -GMP phosphodiesterase 11A [Brachionus plicatilis]
MILNSPGHKIFANVKPKIYQLLISLIKEAILATDVADHMDIRKDFSNLVRSKNVDWNEESNKILLRKNLMTACDLASAAKPWKTHKSVVNQVIKEFFAQGVRERTELNIEPTEIMDERRSDQLPRLQMGWIDAVCFPLYQNLALLCDSFNGHLDRLKENRLNWSLLNEKIKLSQIKEPNKSHYLNGRL